MSTAEENQQQQVPPAAAGLPAGLASKKAPAVINHELVRKYSEYYSRIFPAEEICTWLQYGEKASYLANREFCLTLPGDIFCRFKTFTSAQALRKALTTDRPEKIDVGAVYQVPAEKRHQTPLVPIERELVFDIDMSDYDNIRSCCKGKSICQHCWPWMSTAARVIRLVVEECFGYKIMMPVFSGRRGLHIWVCDAAARKLEDDERQAIVQYMTVVTNGFKLNCVYQLKNNGLHPALRKLFSTEPLGPDGILNNAMRSIFLNKNNANCIFTSAASADVFRNALDFVFTQFASNSRENKESRDNWDARKGAAGTVFDEGAFVDLMNFTNPRAKPVSLALQQGLMLALLYPRLDEKVSTRKDHLLKLPLCVHPGSGRLCCPLEFDSLDKFNPVADAPSIDELIDELGSIPSKWMKPLLDTIQATVREKQELKTN